MKPKVFVAIPTNSHVLKTFVPENVQKYLAENFDVSYNESEKQIPYADFGKAILGFDAVITGWGNPKFDAETLKGNDTLKLIVHTGGTVANYVDDCVYDRGIKVVSGNLLYAESVAEGTLAYMLMAQRRLPDYVNNVRAGGWALPGSADIWESVMDKKVGIIGLGTISRFLIPILHSFRCDIRLFTHHAPDAVFIKQNDITLASLDSIFSECDIISVHSALNTENRGLIGKDLFSKIKPGALFLNTSRGAVIHEDELIEELKTGRFRAVLDVYNKEPLTLESELRTLPNVYCIPHKAGPTLDRRAYITKALVDEMIRFFNGEQFLKLEITKQMAASMTKM